MPASLATDLANARPDIFEIRDGRLGMKFDRIVIFYSLELGSAVAQFHRKGEVVNNVPVPGSKIEGEITIDEIDGVMLLSMDELVTVPGAADRYFPKDEERGPL